MSDSPPGAGRRGEVRGEGKGWRRVRLGRGPIGLLLRDFAGASVLQFADLGLRLVIIKVLTNRLSAEGFGTYSFFVSVIGVGYLVLGLELFRFLHRNVQRVASPHSYLAPALALELGIAAAVFGAAAFFADELSALFNLPLTPATLVLLGALLMLEIVLGEITRLQILLRNVLPVEVAKLVRTALIVVLLVVWPDLRATSYLVIGLLTTGLVLVPCWSIHRRQVRESAVEVGSRGVERVLEMLRYTWPFMVPAFAYHFLKFGDRFFIAGFLGAEQLAMYHIAYNLQLLCYTFGSGLLAAILQPIILREHDRGDTRVQLRVFLVQAIPQLLLSLLLLAGARPVILLTSNATYLDAIPVLWVLFPLPLLMLAYGAITNYLFLIDARVQFAVNNLLAVAVTGAAYVFLIPRFGLHGAAAATLAGYGAIILSFFVHHGASWVASVAFAARNATAPEDPSPPRANESRP